MRSYIIHISMLFVGSSTAFSTPSKFAIQSSSSSSTIFTSDARASSSRLFAVSNKSNINDDTTDDVESRIGGRNISNIFTTLTTRALTSAAVSLAILTSPLHNNINSNIANADEWGKETEAPTLFTGETVMICKKRGPLGACLETTVRTAENDNDKALKYFKDPSAEVKRKQERMLTQMDEDSEGNTLIQKLRKQSLDNKEKNDQTVRTKTLINDQGASFGPFSKEVVILNTDGNTFTLLQNSQAMRLKKAGYIEDRKFVIQPSQDVIDDALVGNEMGDLGDSIKGFFGGGGEGKKEDDIAAVAVSNEDVAVEEKATANVATTEEESVAVVVGDEENVAVE